MCRKFLAHGGDRKISMLNFCRVNNIGQKGRTFHALSCIILVLWLGGTFDCVNLGRAG